MNNQENNESTMEVAPQGTDQPETTVLLPAEASDQPPEEIVLESENPEATETVEITEAAATTEVLTEKEEKPGMGWLWIVIVLLLAVVIAVVVVRKAGKKKEAAPAPRAERSAPRVEAISATVVGEVAQPSAAMPAYSVGCAQTIGGRPYQEDSYGASDWRNPSVLTSRGLLGIMADGVGGLNNGQAASGAVVRGMLSIFSQQDPTRSGSNRLLEMAAFAQSEVLKLNQQGSGSGSTMVSVLIKGYDMNFISVGDSRIALYRAGGLLSLNREHVLGRESDEDAAMGRGAAVTDERRRKAITSYMGKEKLTLIDRNVQPIRLMPGDRILLMSDGVFGTLDNQTLISKMRLSPDQAAKAIIQAVDERQLPHQDNATIVVIGVG